MTSRVFAIVAFILLSTVAAQADIRITGDARMGIVYEPNPNVLNGDARLRISSRTRLLLQFDGQTDGGLRFGGEFQIDDRNSPSGARVSIGN
jgi:hypothetical protein